MLIKTTPQIMEKDKAAFAEKWKGVVTYQVVDEVVDGKGFKIDSEHLAGPTLSGHQWW
jgi:hypothetical protein